MSDASPVFVSSYLNIYSSFRKTSLLFHGVSFELEEVDAELGEAFFRHQASGLSLPDLQGLDFRRDSFLERGFLTVDNPDIERKKTVSYIENLPQTPGDPETRNLLLIPSYQCNVNCSYCYQRNLQNSVSKKPDGAFSMDMIDRLFEVTIPSLYEDYAGKIGITLYGGEPLSETNEAVIQRILLNTKKYGNKAYIVTNGTRLDRFLHLFGTGPGEISTANISMDGDRECHDLPRILGNSGTTFNSILKNIRMLLDRGVRVYVRINLSRRTVDSLPDLLVSMRDEGMLDHPRVTVGCTPVQSYLPMMNAAYTEDYSPWELSKRMREMDIQPVCSSPLIRIRQYLLDILMQKNPSERPVKKGYCNFSKPDEFIIDYLGNVYKCTVEAGYRERRVGVVKEDGTLDLNQRNEFCQTRIVSRFEPCMSCSVVLLCGGGCAVKAERAHGTIFGNSCNSFKELVAQSIVDLHRLKCSGDVRF